MKHYSGKPCHRCGGTLRYVSTAQCVPCQKAQAASWTAANPARKAQIAKDSHRRVRYGVSPEQYAELVAQAKGVCAICCEPCSSGHALGVDHDHSCCPGENGCANCRRGLLCKRCNRLLGDARDSVPLLRAAARYLARWQR